MKRNIFKIGLLALTTLMLSSCSDYFDSVPNDVLDLDKVFTNRGLSLQWLTDVYSYIPDDTNMDRLPDNSTQGVWTAACNEGYLPWIQ